MDSKKAKKGIEDLPDKFLVSVLSRLSLVEAARVSCLSRRWRNIWKLVTCLNFDASTMLSRNKVDESEEWYVNWVDKVIESRKELSVKDFRIHYWLSSRYEDVLKRWVDFAVAKQAEAIHLNLSGYNEVHIILSQRCKFTESQCCQALAGLLNNEILKTLSLTCVDVDTEFIQSIHLGCLQLRILCIAFMKNVCDLIFSRSQLRCLEIMKNPGNALLEIDAPELDTLVYNAEQFRPRNVYLPKLVSLSMHVTDDPLQIWDILRPFGTQFPILLRQLRYLHVGVEDVIMLNLEHLPLFVNLKTLSFHLIYNDNGRRAFLHFVDACPFIEYLKIYIPVKEYTTTDDEAADESDDEAADESDDEAADESDYEAADESDNEAADESDNEAADESKGSNDPAESVPEPVPECPQLENLEEIDIPECPQLENLKEIDLVAFEESVFDWSIIKDVIRKSPNLKKLFIDIKDAYGHKPDVQQKATRLKFLLPLGAKLSLLTRNHDLEGRLIYYELRKFGPDVVRIIRE